MDYVMSRVLGVPGPIGGVCTETTCSRVYVSQTVGLVLYLIFALLGLTAFAVSIIAFTSPAEYNPYEWGFKEEDDHENEHLEPGYDPATAPKKRKIPQSSVTIVVVGDIGRSPRMQYHAISFAKHGARVSLVGFRESEIHPDLQSNSLVKVVPLIPPPTILQSGGRLLFLFLGPLKVVWQFLNLYHTLGYKCEPTQWMLVQNPPSIPTLLVSNIICFLRNTRLVIDWHNFGWSVLGLKLGKRHPLVLIAWIYEWMWAHGADAHFTVTNAMSKRLRKEIGIDTLALHDRPVASFQPKVKSERHAFLQQLEQTAPFADDINAGTWRLLVSSTSWTADEDFSILLNGLVRYSATVESDKRLPKLLAIITGKGPQKAHYLKRIEELNQANKLVNVVITTAWLTTQDYASLLASADLGVSLHKSASGVDLPMKVVDMFGAGLPVIGWGAFESWPELVKEGINGRSFETSDQLHSLLIDLFSDGAVRLLMLKDGALNEGSRRWDDTWDDVAGVQCFALTTRTSQTANK